MTNVFKVSATVVSHAGIYSENPQNTDNFYINGRYKYDYEPENIQVTTESSGDEFFFAVSDGLEMERPDNKSPISLVREMKRFQEQVKGNGKSIESIYLQLVDRIEEISNLIHSTSLINPEEKESRTGLACLVLARNKAVVVSLGASKVYMARGGNIKQITNDHKKAERLIKLGIISSEQAEVLSKDYEGDTAENKSEIQISPVFEVEPGDIFLLCSDGLSEQLEEENICEVLAMNFGTEYISNTLLKEIIKDSELTDSATALAVKVEEMSQAAARPQSKANTVVPSRSRRIERDEEDGEESSSGTSKLIVGAIVAGIVIMAAIISGYVIWNTLKSDLPDNGPKTAVETQAAVKDQQTKDPTQQQTPSTSQSSNVTPDAGKEPVKYTIVKGDTLTRISQKFYKDSDKYKIIMEANNIKDPSKISVGQTIIIPDISK